MVLFWKHGTSIPVDHHHVGRMKTAINWEAHIPFPDTHRSINSSWLYIPFIFLIAIPSYSYCCEFYIVLCPQFHRFHSKSHVHGSFFFILLLGLPHYHIIYHLYKSHVHASFFFLLIHHLSSLGRTVVWLAQPKSSTPGLALQFQWLRGGVVVDRYDRNVRWSYESWYPLVI
jgi:hypothetical protein